MRIRTLISLIVLWAVTDCLFVTKPAAAAIAQPSPSYDLYDRCSRMMGGGMGTTWVGMVIAWLVGIAAIAALVAATVYLIRRSRMH